MNYSKVMLVEKEYVKAGRRMLDLRSADGEIYKGEINDDSPTGKGFYQFHTGEYYIGDWKDGACDGKGILSFASGAVYEGDWRKGRREGFGVLKYPSGETYIGEFHNDQKHGKGTSILEYGVHEGFYVNDLAQNKGTVKYNNGVVYEGSFVAAVLQGQGVMRYPCGVVFEGEFQNNLRTSGVFTWPNGDRFAIERTLLNKNYAGKGSFYMLTAAEAAAEAAATSTTASIENQSAVQPFQGRVFVCKSVPNDEECNEQGKKEFVVFEWDNGDIWKGELESEEQNEVKSDQQLLPSGDTVAIEVEQQEEKKKKEEEEKQKKATTKRIILNGFQLTNAAGENMLKNLIRLKEEDSTTPRRRESDLHICYSETSPEPQRKKAKLGGGP